MLVDEKIRISTLVDKANDSLGTAEILLEKGLNEEAALACYHAVFFMLRATLMKNGIPLEKTSDSLKAFQSAFISTDRVTKSCFDDIQHVLKTNGFLPYEFSFEISNTAACEVFQCSNRVYDELIDLIY